MQLYVLDRAKNTLATTSSFYSDKHHKELTAGASIFEFTIDKSDSAAQYMTTGNYLVFLDDRGRAWSFTILSYDETQTTKTVAAEDVSIELLNKAMDIWNTDQAYPFSYYFDLITKGTPWKLGDNQLTDLSRKLVYTGRDTGLGRLLSVLKGFDHAECQFNIKVQQNKPVEFTVDVYKSIGTVQDNIQIVYNNELNDIKKTESRAQFVTALAGVGGLVENQATTDPGLEKHIDFTDIDYKDDNFVSPKGDKFLRAVTANRIFNPGTTTYIEDFYDYDTQSAQELLNRTLTQLKERSEPQYTYDADVKVIDPTLDIGDTVTIIDHDYNPALYLQARVATLDKSYTDPTQGAITFCNYRLLNSNLSDQLRAMQNIIDQLPTSASIKVINNNIVQMIADNTELKKQVTFALQSADGKNVNYYGPDKPMQPNAGDIWFKQNGDKQVMMIYRDGQWHELASDMTGEEIKSKVDEAFANDEALQKRVEDNDTKIADNIAKTDAAVDAANQAVSAAGFANDAADQAKTAADNAQADAANAKIQATNADTQANQAVVDASTAKADAATALNDATTAKADANTAKINATQAINDAAAAKGQATNALGQASTAIGNAADALNKINSMSVGGRNYLLNSATFSPRWSKNLQANAEIFELITEAGVDNKVLHIKNSFGPSPIGLYHTPAHKFLIGEIITQSILVRGHGQVRLNFNGMLKTFTIDSDTYTKIYMTGNVANGAAFTVYVTDIGEIWCHSPKVETGSLATDWTPAPEDVQQQFTDINGELANKVSQTTYNTLAGTVDTVSTLAKQNQSTISTLATKTSVDTVSKTATTAQTLAQQNANELLNKASTNTVDTLTQRVTTAESTLSQTATKAELALTKTDVDKLGDSVASQALDIAAAADGLKLKADSSTVSDLAGTVAQNSAQLGLTATKADLALTQNDVNDLDDTVNKQATQLALTATKAELQVAQTNVDNLKKTVTSNTAGMTANANALKLKADSSTVSSLDGRVTKLSGQLDVQADKISATVTASDVTGMLGNYATQSWSQGQISAAKNEITASVETVKQKVNNMQVGGRNLYLNSKSIKDGYGTNDGAKVTVESFDDTTNMWHIVKEQGTGTNVGIYLYGYADDKLPDTSDWSYSADVKGTGNIGAFGMTGNHKPTVGTISSEWSRISQTGHFDNAKNKTLVMYFDTTSSPLDVYIKLPKLEIGNKATDWSPAPEDMATAVQFTSIEETLKGVQVTANNAVTQSQYTQLADQFTSTIANTGAPNLVSMTGWNGVNTTTHAYYTGNQPLYEIANASTSAVIMARSSRFAIKANTTYTLSFFGFGTSNAKPINVYVLGRKNGETADFTTISLPIAMLQLPPGGYNFTFSGTFTTGAIDNAYVRVDNNGTTDSTGGSIYFTEVQLEEGSVATPYRVSDNQISSQFTQLQNDINLRVKTGDLVSQINVSAGNVLIQSGKLYLDAASVVMGGTAFINAANIKSVNASTITTGTLNAAKVNVVNLNASNITTGVINGANLSINLNTGQVLFQKGRIHSTSNNIDINVDQGYVSVANGNARVMLKDGGIQFVQPNVFDVSTKPYLSISNGGNGLAYVGARIVGYNYAVLSNSANASNIFDQVIDGAETFAGISMGYDGSSWHPTKIGGAERGIILSAGQPLSSNVSVIGSPASITIGTKGQGAWGGNRIELTGEYVHSLSTYTKTSSGSANVIVSQDGALVRSTSAAKYKTDIQRTMGDDYGQKLLNLPTATWLDKADMKRYSDDPINQPVPTRNFGMIAEDLAAAGLEYLVVRGQDGQLEGIEYDRIGPALIPVIAKLQKRIEILEQLKGEI